MSISINNKFNVKELAKPGQRVIKVVKDEIAEYYPVGLSVLVNKSPVVETVFYHETYDSVCYLDDENDIRSVGWNGEPPQIIDLWIRSLDDSSNGNIVLQYGSNETVLAVTPQLTRHSWSLQHAAAGEIHILRLTDDPRDTLKNSSEVVTAIVTDWQVV